LADIRLGEEAVGEVVGEGPLAVVFEVVDGGLNGGRESG
jgi:hypothetical protein